MRTIFQLAVLGVLATPAGAESLEVLGYAGVLGEWELTASVTGNDNTRAYSGPLTMTHVGICTVDGPEEKKGEIRFRLSDHHREYRRHYWLMAPNAATVPDYRTSLPEP